MFVGLMLSHYVLKCVSERLYFKLRGSYNHMRIILDNCRLLVENCDVMEFPWKITTYSNQHFPCTKRYFTMNSHNHMYMNSVYQSNDVQLKYTEMPTRSHNYN